MVEAVGSTVEVADCLGFGSGPGNLKDPTPPTGVGANCSSKRSQFWLLWDLGYIAWYLLDHWLSREGLRGTTLVTGWDTEIRSCGQKLHQV